MGYLNGRLQCDMNQACTAPIARMDEKGWVYCDGHGLQRKSSMRCRRLSGPELRVLQSGKPLDCYDAKRSLNRLKPDLLAVLKRTQSALCEHCPPGDLDTNCGEHTDACLAAIEAIETAQSLRV